MKLTDHARAIVVILVDNEYFKDESIKGTSLYDLLMNRLHWYLINIESDMTYEAPQYTRQLTKEISDYLKDFISRKVDKK